MSVDQATLNEIVRRVLSVAKPEKIILYGSAATGGMTRDSDIDLLIVDTLVTNRHEQTISIEQAIGGVDFPVDVRMIAADRFEATKHVIGGLAYPAYKYGKILYEAA